VSINIVTPNGTRFNDRTFYNTDDFSAARNQNNVTIGKNWVHGDLNKYELHAESQKGRGADLVFTRDAPSWQAGNSKWYFDKSLTQYLGWFPAVPSAKVEGTLTYNGQSHEVQGTGYHDHNWGTVDMNKVIDNWYWGQGRLGNYTVVFFPFVGSSFYNYQQLPILYLAKGNDILIGDTSLTTWKASENQTYAPFNRTYPGLLELNYKNGSDTVNLSITDPKILSASNSILVTNATTLGIPQYMRFSGTGELSVNMNGINETVSGPMTWEKNFAN
jgi:predicted secreted hydrolase